MGTRWTVEDIPSQEGRTIVVTGATSGLGLESATALARAGARVLMAARNAAKAEAARTDVAAVATGPEPEVVALDLADLASVRAAAEDIAERAPQLDVLMNNAGVMALPHATTADGFEMQLGTNHLGHFALTGLLLPQLLAAAAAGTGTRVVTTSSGAHKPGRIRWDDLQWEKRYQRWMAYSQSKLANLLFAYELDRRARAAKTALASVAAHPGYASTHLQAAGPELKGSKIGVRLWDGSNRISAQPAADGALPQLYAATMPDVRGGEYLGPAGLFEMRGAPTRVDSTTRSHSQEDATRLWDVSERLTGVTFRWPEAGAGPR